MDNTKLRDITMGMINAGVKSADPLDLISPFIRGHSLIFPEGETYHSEDYKEVLLFAVGKASQRMALAFDHWDISDGLIITDSRAPLQESKIPIRYCSHPIPGEDNIAATREIIDKLEGRHDTLILFLISGGASSLFCLPEEGISINDVAALNQQMLLSGASIKEINTVRKHISQVKGGKFARLCQGKGEIITLILSDVVGDDMSVVGSGPTVEDRTTYGDAKDILERYSIWENAPRLIKEHINRRFIKGDKDYHLETNVHNHLVGSNMDAIRGAMEYGKVRGMPFLILTSQNQGEAREVAKVIMGIAKECQDSGKPAETPVALLVGGEMTTKMEKTGSFGGPNREFVLSAAMEIKDRSNIVVAAVDTDGVDGKGKAGAIADCETVKRSNIDPYKCLAEHDTERFFDALGDSIELPVNTNVNDLIVVTVGKK